jgi:PAS domain S-box-containing protein
MAARHSLRLRLPLLISALLVAVVTILLWGAYREVEATLVRAWGDRARGAADQVANLLARPTQAGLENLRRVAADAAVRRYLQDPTDGTREATRARLAPLATAGVRAIDLWNANGSRLLNISLPATVPGALPVVLPAAARPPAVGLNALQEKNNVVFTDSAAEVWGEPFSADQAVTSARLGYVVVRSTLSVNPPGALGRLVGVDAVIEIGNTAGGTWTDLSSIVTAPPVDLTRDGVAEYRAANGEMRLGAVSTIRGTPWAVWVEFPRSIIVAPARVFLGQMIGLALIVVAIGAVLVGNLSVRITRPLHELVQAADEIAAGDYSRRVSAPRSDEIGRLGRAFNAMVADVKDTHQQLQARVLERTSALEALGASEAHYRTIVEVALDCIITIDAQGRVVEFNPAAERTFGYRKRDVVGRELAELIVPPGSRNAHRNGLARYMATGESSLIGQRIEMTAMRSDGTQFPVELALSAVHSDGPPMVTGVARDLTERKRMDETRLESQAIEEQNHRMLEANRLKSEFLANMSHELRTPLNAIIGFAELMHRGKVGPVSADHEEYLGDILTSSKHLLQLINDVLDLAKVESGKMEFRPEPVDLAKLVNEVRDTLRGLVASHGLRIETDVDPEVSAAAVDPARVKQILYNYLSNAIKFTPEGGRVSVRITPEGPDMFRIDVGDTGVGIPAEDLGKLFVEFQQLDAGTAKKHQGSGLGLALVKRLVEAQGGRVAVRSTPGEGSTFSAVLPRKMAIDLCADVSPAIEPPPGNRTILVVDDDPATLKLADVALRELGHRPVCRDNAAAALLAAEANPPAVVIVDLLMPHTDGFEFISRLRALPGGCDVPILVWTVKDLDAAERHRLQASAAVIVSKSTGGSHALAEVLRRLLPPASSGPEGTDGA